MKDYIVFIPLAVMLAGLVPFLLIDKYISKKQKNIMMSIIAAIALLLVQNCGDYICQMQDNPLPIYRTLFDIAGYSLRPLILALFCKLVQPEKKHILAWSAVICNALIYSTALFSDIAFYIDERNHFVRGPLSYSVFYVSVLLLAYLLYCSIDEYRKSRFGIHVTLVNEFLVILGFSADQSPLYVDYPVTYLSIAAVCSTFFYYIWMHLEFEQEHEDALKADQRIKIMMSQIQPHFLYNTLTTIQSLCLIDPQKAFETTGKFGAYLRNNIDSLDYSGLIPIKKELEHTKHYADIEMLRFSNITLDYHIDANDFLLPVLTIQPIVENAIRHGVRECEHGTVEISTAETDDEYIVAISDNGKGFDVEEQPVTDGSHIGIKNVRERIEEMCGGSLTVESRIGEGTVVTIRIPRRV